MQAKSTLEPTAIRHDYARVGEIRLHYAECGTSNEELVILLHGFPEFWYSWRHQLPVLGGHYHVVAPDMRGYNLSDKPPRVEDYRKWADSSAHTFHLWRAGHCSDSVYRERSWPIHRCAVPRIADS